jgi:hypothetical protein
MRKTIVTMPGKGGTSIPIEVPIPTIEDLLAGQFDGDVQGYIHEDKYLDNEMIDADEYSGATAGDKRRKTGKSKALTFDPDYVTALMNTTNRPQSPISFELLRRMSFQCKPIRAIIQTRKNQIANYCRPVRRKGEQGFKISLKEVERKATASDKQRMKEVTLTLMNSGYTTTTTTGDKRDDMETFVRRIIEDRLVLDAACFERVFDGLGRLVEWVPVDGATIRKVIDSNQYVMQAPYKQLYSNTSVRARRVPSGKVSYIQVIKGNVVTEFTDRDLAYKIANPRSDIYSFGYGMSELEMLVEVVTSILFAEQYNRNAFTQGAIPQGVISLIGNYDDEMLEAFKRQWALTVAGVQNSHRLPVIALTDGEGFKFTPFNMSSKDMEFHLWITFLVALASGIYQIDPEEFGFQGYKPSGSGSLFQQGGEYKQEQSKDRGLKPLMTFTANFLNSEIIDYIYDDMMLEWVGFDEKSEKERLEAQQMELQMGTKTVNMIKDENDEERIKAEWADAPANPTLMQLYMKNKEEEAQAAMQEEQQKNAMIQEMMGGDQQGEGNNRVRQDKKKPIKKDMKKSITDGEVVLEIEI